MKNAADMTLEEFAQELIRIREKAWYIKTSVGSRTDRPYKNQQRGDFYGKENKK